MRAAEFIQKLVNMIDTVEKQGSASQAAPPQQIVININGGTATVADNAIKPSGEPVVDPADRKGSDGKNKWTPPLQQQLDTIKTDVAKNQADPATMMNDPAILGH
jgi:hypothetical protein